MGIAILRLTAAALLPVLFAVVFYRAEQKTSFARLSYAAKQTVIGIVFGLIAALATEFGVPIEGAVINVRTAAPLTAGLVFGGPAGIIAGLIGGVHRWLATLWGIGEYSRVACTIATIFAGFLAAACRKYMFDDKKPSYLYGLAIGVTTEVLHMLLVFLTNMDDIHTAFTIVTECAVPMISSNALSVTLALLCVSMLSKERLHVSGEKRRISQVFQLVLFVSMVAAFIVTCLFTYTLQTRIAVADAEKLLKINISDVETDISDASDKNLLRITRSVASEVDALTDSADLAELAERYKVAEINLVDANGIITFSTNEAFINYDMASGEQSAEFLCLLVDTGSYVQEYQPISYNEKISRKYAGVALAKGGFVQVGYDAKQFQEEIADQVIHAAKNRHIGKDGSIIICDENLTIISDRYDHEGETLEYTGLIDDPAISENSSFTATLFGVERFCVYTVSEGYYIIGALPVSEEMFSRNIAVYIMAFMEIVVFAALFANIYFLIKRLVVDNIHKVNNSLAQITSGNLDVTVDVRSNMEFASLSDDINSTVETLKRYIAEAAARIDKELVFAREIQHSALPSVFPPYPTRGDFDIYAVMDAAREVGGDFYDFYMLDGDRLGFVIADVSGKGIPAAMFMMTAKTTIKGLAESGMSVNDILTRANERLCEGNDAGMFVTAWMGILDLSTGRLSYANAGHNPPLVRHRNGKFEYMRARANLVLAGLEGTKYSRNELMLAPGDELFLYTDGVTEATDSHNELYGESRLLSALNADPNESVEERCKSILESVDVFVGDAEQFDDITMLSLRLNSVQTSDGITVSPDLSRAEDVRRFIDDRAKRDSLPVKLANRVKVCVDEVFSNICQYSRASIAEINYTIDDGLLTLRFRDDGLPYDPTRTPDPEVTLSAEERDIGGLGVFMVKNYASSMDYEHARGFNTLTLTFEF